LKVLRLVDPTKADTVALEPRRSSAGPCYGVDFKRVDGIFGLVVGIDDDGPYVRFLDELGNDSRTFRLEWTAVIGEAIRDRRRP
jgi:hypothetical protein